MNLVGVKVRHKAFGNGVITALDGDMITVDFAGKNIELTYPSAFEKFMKAEDESIQVEIERSIDEAKKAKSEQLKSIEQEAKAKTEIKQITKSSKAKSLDEMFSEDYHAEHLARQPILTYQQVETQYGIKITGFGRGINITESTVVLISSIGKSAGKFTYHDRWTSDGDYLYSGEGKTGDQTLTRGNLAIKDAEKDNKDIHLFIKFSPQEYIYQGIVKLVDYSYEDDKDEDGNIRKEYKFRLRRI